MIRQTSPSVQKTWYGSNRRVRFAMILGSVAVLAMVLVIRSYWSAEPASAQTPRQAPRRSPEPAVAKSPTRQSAKTTTSKLDVVAKVNGEPITREELARECLRHYGEEVLESYVNKCLIAMECKRLGLQITQREVNAEVERMAKHFNLSLQQWYKMLADERGVTPSQYTNDIVWPTLALRKLAAEQLQVSNEELRHAYETQFGPAVKARLIACKDPQKAEKIRAEVIARPDDFGRVAKLRSEDAPSASDMGWIPPIRMHGGPKEIETAAFGMKDGEISPIIKVNDQCVILKREMGIPARGVPFEQAAPQLKQMIEERKLRKVSTAIFRRLQQQAKVENYFNDASKRDTGVVAVLNGKKIMLAQLAEASLERHGEEVLEGTINRKLIEQACKKAKITVTDAELQAEIRRAAEASVPPKKDGSPDIEAWIKLATEEQGVSREVYIRDAVWPSVALRKLIGSQINVTEEDIQRGFEANYGPRVRCLAMVFGDLRLAQRVWTMAREKYGDLETLYEKQKSSGMDPEKAKSLFATAFVSFFGDLAEQYSIEPGSKKLRGQVPPIKKHGGQPILEKEAFALVAGELSGIIQVGDKYVVLYCEGHTTPVKVDMKAVRELIVEDLREKKMRIAMGEYFQRLQDFATIDNYLAGTTQSPPRQAQAAPSVPKLQQVSSRR
ncbi:MAG: peptidylprolyl isomerase [Pirellulales bacterium]|nr:peptidylprolyl isomerase [Pirellulales bacterium]